MTAPGVVAAPPVPAVPAVPRGAALSQRSTTEQNSQPCTTEAPPARRGEEHFNRPGRPEQDTEGQVRAGASLPSCRLRERARSSCQHAEPSPQPELGTAREEGAWRKQHASKWQQLSPPCQNLHKIISCKSSFCFKLDF